MEKLTKFFDPLAGTEEEEEELAPSPMAIEREKKSGRTYYSLRGDIPVPAVEKKQAMLSLLSMYPQHLNIFEENFSTVARQMLKNIFSGITFYSRVISDIQKRVYIAGPIPSEPEKYARHMREIFHAIRIESPLWMKYLRTRDGEITERILEPYGFFKSDE